MKVVFHYDAGPGLVGRLAALSAEGLSVTPCAEGDHARFSRLMAGAEVLWHVLRPVTAEVIAGAAFPTQGPGKAIPYAANFCSTTLA